MDLQNLLFDLLVNGVNQCKLVLNSDAPLLISLFVAGLIGSAAHCVGMCGPFVMAQVSARLETVPVAKMSEFHRLRGAALFPYHVGRLTTYCALGGLSAMLAGGVGSLTGLKWMSVTLLSLAAVLFFGYGLQRLGIAFPGFHRSGEASGWGNGFLKFAAPLFKRPLGWRGYGLGLMLGFIPCGLLYGAVAASASLGGFAGGVMSMAAFGLGTVPMLLAVGIASHLAMKRWREVSGRILPFLMLVNAMALAFMAWRLV